MKILYSAGNRIGAALQIARFKSALPSEYQLKIAAFHQSSRLLPIVDWTLDALYHPLEVKSSIEYFLGYKGAPKVNSLNFRKLAQDIIDYDPDLVICDGEAVVAHIATALNKTLWYCSPLHLLDGIIWKQNQLQYQAKLENYGKFLKSLPIPSQYFIYSPWGSALTVPPIKDNYTWIQPYVSSIETTNLTRKPSAIQCLDPKRFPILIQILNSIFEEIVILQDNTLQSSYDCLFLTGETSYLADILYNSSYEELYLIPNLEDPEAILNVIMCNNCKWGKDLGQIELLERHAPDEIIKAMKIKKNNSKFSLQQEMNPTLDQKVIEYACSF